MSYSTSHNIPHHQNNNMVIMNISCHNNNNNNNNNNTTFVEANPSNFRFVVQKLTGHESDKLPFIRKSNSIEKCPRSSSTFKLHERRHSARKLENIFTDNNKKITIMSTRQKISSSSFVASPVSPLEMLTRGISPRSTMEEEEEAIAEKRFYLHPNTPRASHPPQLLPLFPLQSP